MRGLTMTDEVAGRLLSGFHPAMVASTRGSVVPEWLYIAAGLVALAIAIMLIVDAYQLHKVAEGSMVAVNIGYMIAGVVCLALSTVLRWVIVFLGEATLVEQMSFSADLLVTAGMALLAVYFYKVRTAMSGYLKSLSESMQDKGLEPEGEDG